MRGDDEQSGHLFSYLSPEQRVPADHPLRAIRAMTDDGPAPIVAPVRGDVCEDGPAVDPAGASAAGAAAPGAVFGAQRADADGATRIQPAVPLVCRPGMDDAVWVPTTFTKNRDRLLRATSRAPSLKMSSRRRAGRRLLSAEHFTVDGTLLEAWAGQKSFKRKDQPSDPPDDPGNPTVNFHGERRSNQTHQSTTDPDSRLFKKAKGHEAKLAYLGEVLMENRHGLVVDACVVPATGTGERDAAIGLIAESAAPTGHRRRRQGL